MKLFLQYNNRGWIPGPEESKGDFEKRIEALNQFFSYPPEDIDHFLTDQDWTNANLEVERLYGFSPDWIVAHYSDRNLSFFQGAATWITEKKGLRIPLVQLRRKLETGRLLGLYGREEVLAHEAVHAARMQFDEPLFEEIFAYQTSPRFWRRLLGPLFQKPWEAYVFLIALLIPIAIEITLFFDVSLGPFEQLRLLPLAIFLYLFCRLLSLRWILWRAKKRLKTLLKDPKKSWAVAFRMTDREIFRFAFQKDEKLTDYLKEQKNLRWDQIFESYFK